MKGKFFGSIVALAMVTAVVAAPAQALSVSRTGSSAYSSSTLVRNTDTLPANGRFTSTPWQTVTGGSGSLVNKTHSGTNLNEYRSGVINIRACESRPVAPMVCSAWAV